MSVNRISGLATGMDTYQMVQDMMKAHRKPVDKLRQQRQILLWQREDYRAVNSALLAFRNTVVFPMRLSSTFLANAVESSQPSVVGATALPTAAPATYAVTVHELATTAFRTSQSRISAEGGQVDADAAIWQQRAAFDRDQFNWNLETIDSEHIAGTGAVSYALTHSWITQGSVTVTVIDGEQNERVYTVYYSEEEYNAGVEEHKALVDVESGELRFNEAVAEGETVVSGYEYNTRTFDFTITTYNQEGAGGEAANTKTFTVDAAQQSLNRVLDDINNARELKLTAFYDAGADKVSLSTRHTGDNNPGGDEINLEGAAFLTQVLGLTSEQGGTNARVTINGMTVERAANSFTLNNMNFSLRAEGSSTVTVSADTDAVFGQIKKFIEEYNAVLDMVNGRLREERFRDYLPLLDDDPVRERMTEKQIDQWEQKARSGLLHRDNILSGIVNRLRADIFTTVTGLDPSLSHLAHIGITLGRFADQGKLVIDEAKLKTAIDQDPEGVAALFNRSGATTAEQGIGRRLYGYLDTAVKQLTNQAGSPSYTSTLDPSWLGRQVGVLDERVQRSEERLARLEDRYWKQFTALERAIDRMNTQSTWLMMQFGGGLFQR